MGMAHYYQKVINFQATLIFVLGVPRFALLWRIFIRCCCENVPILYQSAAANRCDTGLCGDFSQI